MPLITNTQEVTDRYKNRKQVKLEALRDHKHLPRQVLPPDEYNSLNTASIYVAFKL